MFLALGLKAAGRYSYPVVFEEGWTEFIGGIRSASRNPSPGNDGYEEFEKNLKNRFESQAVDGFTEVKYITELAVGWLLG